MANNKTQNDDVLFEKLRKNKSKKRLKVILTAVIITTIIGTAVFFVVKHYTKKVNEGAAMMEKDVLSYEASIGSISTTVSGSGTLEAVGDEKLCIPEGVEVDEVLLEKGDKVAEGDVIATLKMSSIMTALSDKQAELDLLDSKIDDADDDSVNKYIKSGVAGRVKQINAGNGENVIDCMTNKGSLAVISLDGCMAVDIEKQMNSGAEVTVTADGKGYKGKVSSSGTNGSTVTLTDNGPVCGANAEVKDENGVSVGSGALYIHSPLSVTGYAGTVVKVNVKENDTVKAGTTLFTLGDTEYSANYDALLKSREEKEEELSELIELMCTGSLKAPTSGVIGKVDYEDDGSDDASETQSAGASNPLMSYYAMFGLGGGNTAAASSASDTSETADGEVAVVTLVPEEEVSVTISIDESNILSLEIGQSADVTVSAISDEPIHGTVTDINKNAESSNGITSYSAVITIPRGENMLIGMSANVDIKIDGKENAVIIPVDAINKTSTSTYVYTEYDPALREYGGMKEVTVGISNSNYIEIESGLEEGETVYYTERRKGFFFGMSGMNFGNMSGFSGMGGGAGR